MNSITKIRLFRSLKFLGAFGIVVLYATGLPHQTVRSIASVPNQTEPTSGQPLKPDLDTLSARAMQLNQHTQNEWSSQNSLNDWVLEYVSTQVRSQQEQISQTILETSRQYQFDPLFLLAVIQNESAFNSRAVGRAGEIGLMQITPATARWICQKSKIQWSGKKALFNPRFNIQVGTAYLAYLKNHFRSEARLYLSAYNMGTSHLRNALQRHIVPKEYSSRVFFHYRNIAQAARRKSAKSA